MFQILLAATIIAGLFLFWYLTFSVHRMLPVQTLEGSRGKRILFWLLAAVPVLLLVLYCRFHLVTGLIVAVHLAAFRMLCGLALWLWEKVPFGKRIYEFDAGRESALFGEMDTANRARGSRKAHGPLRVRRSGKASGTRKARRARIAGAATVLITTVYLAVGWYLAHHVVVTEYHLTTEKPLGTDRLRIVQISDSHVGATFDGEGFARHMETVQELQPDVVVITGDYVDDDTTKANMVRCGQALGELDTTFGVYYVFGNHDKGYFQGRDFSVQDLRDNLQENGVVILEDEAGMLTDSVCLIGRQDRSEPARADMTALMELAEKTAAEAAAAAAGEQSYRFGTETADTLATDLYTIVLDHQPHDFEAQAAAGADLVLCGHTHGGQMFPIGITGELTGANDKTYGLEVRGNTTFIVNSGISDWAIPFKTAAVAEIGVIDIRTEQ